MVLLTEKKVKIWNGTFEIISTIPCKKSWDTVLMKECFSVSDSFVFCYPCPPFQCCCSHKISDNLTYSTLKRGKGNRWDSMQFNWKRGKSTDYSCCVSTILHGIAGMSHCPRNSKQSYNYSWLQVWDVFKVSSYICIQEDIEKDLLMVACRVAKSVTVCHQNSQVKLCCYFFLQCSFVLFCVSYSKRDKKSSSIPMIKSCVVCKHESVLHQVACVFIEPLSTSTLEFVFICCVSLINCRMIDVK